MANHKTPAAVRDPAKEPPESSVIYQRYTKLLRKRNTYLRYFEENLPTIDRALRRVQVCRAVKVVPRTPIFESYSREKGSPFVGYRSAHVEFDMEVLGETSGKENETLKEYARRVSGRKGARLRRKKERKFIQEGERWFRKRQMKEMEEKRRQAEDVLRSAARAYGVEEDSRVVSRLGAQIRPPPEFALDTWICDPEVVQEEEIQGALRTLGIREVTVYSRPNLMPSSSQWEDCCERIATCDSCGYTAPDSDIQDCPRCEARLRIRRTRYSHRRERERRRGRGSRRH